MAGFIAQHTVNRILVIKSLYCALNNQEGTVNKMVDNSRKLFGYGIEYDHPFAYYLMYQVLQHEADAWPSMRLTYSPPPQD